MGGPSSTSELMEQGASFRFYYEDDAQRGVVRPLLTSAADWDEVPNIAGERISADTIVAQMKDEGLGHLNGLADAMAHNLQLMKETIHYPDALPDGFVNPVAVLRRALPNLMPAAEEVSTGLYLVLGIEGCPDVERRQKLIAALDAFLQSSEQIMRLTRQTGGSKSTAHWHDDAYFLAIELYGHARDLGKSIPLSKPDSSGVRLIARLLDLAFVNHSGVDAIAKELNRKRNLEQFLND